MKTQKIEMLLVAIGSICFGVMVSLLVGVPLIGAGSAGVTYFIIRTWMGSYSKRLVTNAIATIAFSAFILGAVGTVAFQTYALNKMSPKAQTDYAFAISHAAVMK